MNTSNGLKEQIVKSLERLPEETLPEVMTFLEYLQYKQVRSTSGPTPYVPVPLGGIWAGVTITDEDIAEARREMWANFGELDE
ncbi:MAG: DUF2281 domain-containing protein [Chloroflexi bacterium]|nr:DUF2281 domain-containing protein [Chloroflexota bacterium]MCI0575054.1 DUF2281 domain-containing protein [Chloroflexota bacterium]MCI0643580.1 DUF2281 domain-containing protein [Chloroflexota bacterium]MCI0726202.1 DUF2281 domain-containing protein [Chloroflexota bacterium]